MGGNGRKIFSHYCGIEWSSKSGLSFLPMVEIVLFFFGFLEFFNPLTPVRAIAFVPLLTSLPLTKIGTTCTQVVQGEKIFSILPRCQWLGQLSLKYAPKCSEIGFENLRAKFPATTMGDKSSWDSWLNRVLIAAYHLFFFKSGLYWEPAPLPLFNVVQERGKF